jgi:response regulator RpfG family c-di-GMP phosphodiesterase
MYSKQSQTILVVDNDLISYQIVQNCFFSDNVDVRWAKTAAQALAIDAHIRVILCAIPFVKTDSYDLVAQLGHKHPKAVIFMLPIAHTSYDTFQARNAGALGAFFKPLSFSKLESRLEEFLDISSSGDLERIYIPSQSEQIAKLISYQSSNREIEDIEDIVREVLPVVVEQLLRIQLQNNSILREIIEATVQETIDKELNTTLKKLLSTHTNTVP